MAGKTLKMFFGLAILLSIGLALFLYYYNKPHIDVNEADVAFSLTAQQLINEYKKDEQGTTEKYAELIIEVTGKIQDISTSNGNSVVTIKPSNADATVICNMQPKESQKVLKLTKGKQVQIKGVCSGYLLDVVMVRCILVD